MSRTLPCALALAGFVSAGQALPPPRDGDIRVLYYELRNETTVWLTLQPRQADGKPGPTATLLTLNWHFPGKFAPPPEHVELRAIVGFLWAPRVELSLILDDGEVIDLLPVGVMSFSEGGGMDYVTGRVPIDLLRRIARAKRVRIKALGLEFELLPSQREAVGTYLERVLSDNPGNFRK
jgi:hypothetical protein